VSYFYQQKRRENSTGAKTNKQTNNHNNYDSVALFYMLYRFLYFLAAVPLDMNLLSKRIVWTGIVISMILVIIFSWYIITDQVVNEDVTEQPIQVNRDWDPWRLL
jgi:hypothetical protein